MKAVECVRTEYAMEGYCSTQTKENYFALFYSKDSRQMLLLYFITHTCKNSAKEQTTCVSTKINARKVSVIQLTLSMKLHEVLCQDPKSKAIV